MVKQSDNIAHRLSDRQISTRPPGTQLHKVRRLYENIVPGHTVYDVECPDHVFRKFTNDGQYLIAFTRTYHHLVVYRFNWMSYSLQGEDHPPKPAKFESFFTQLYCVSLASGNESICKDFFLTTENGLYGLFATCTRPDNDSSTTEGAVPGVPSLDMIKLLIVRLADGVVTDDRVYRDDFIHLSHNTGVFMYEDLLAVLSIRNQCVHILQIRVTTGTFVDVTKVGDFCQEDDELLLRSQTQKEMWFQSKLRKAKDSTVEQPMGSTGTELRRTHCVGGNHPPVSGLYDPTDVHIEGYFRGLLSDSTGSEQRNAAAAHSSLRISSANSRTSTALHAAALPSDSGRVDYHPQQSSANNAEGTSERRSEYVITSRHLVEESSFANSGAVQQSGLRTPVSSSGSRSAFEPYSGSTGAEVSLPSTTVTTSSRNETGGQTSNLPTRIVPPFLSRLGRIVDSSRTSQREGSSEHEHQQTAVPARTICGIKQRLLSFIFRSACKHQRLKWFYYHFQHYLELVMWKVQFLDRHHLLIKFGSADGVLSRDASQQPAFFVVYNLDTTEILEFQPNSSEDFLQLFENYADHFRASQRYPLFMNYVTSYANNMFVREQIREQKAACVNVKGSIKANSCQQIARRTLSFLPVNPQSHSPSVYFDHSLFHFDEKLISATDRHKPSMEHPIKFISRRRPHSLKFKINPGPENGGNDSRVKRVAAFIFHPIFPFAISIQQSFMQPSIINFHLRR